jgi:molybdate transport system substrate-binding protein
MTMLLRAGLAALLSMLACSAGAADLRVLTAGAVKPLVLALAPAFEQRSGHRLVLENDTAGALLRRATAGERFDVIVVTGAGAEQLAAAGKLAPGSARMLARVGIGVGVLPGAPAPDLSSVEGFRRTVLAARAVAMIDPAAGGSSGIYLAQLFERLGIATAVRAKAVLVPGGLTALRLLSGEADLAVQQMSEIVAVPGVVFAGPIPAELQNYAVYAGAVSARSAEKTAALAFLDLLGSAEARALFARSGLALP